MAFYSRGVEDAVGAYHEIEAEARREILECGGSISHHHGVGKLRLPFVSDIMSPAMIAWREQMKSALDSQGVFASQTPLESHQTLSSTMT
jgi:alkyldihydroxyacetonephosphate synthase